MAELPERKVLKEILAKLKAKTISEEDHFNNQMHNTWNLFIRSDDQALKLVEERKGNISVESHKNVVHILLEQVGDLIHDSIHILEDMKLYIDSLEKYSTELDKTLSEIFEQARKQAEEQIKQQAEFVKKGSTEYIQ